MMGGFHRKDNIEQSDRDILVPHAQQITTKAGNGVTGTNYTINELYTQVVAGTNYFFKLTSQNGKPVHAAIHKPLPHTNQPTKLHDADYGHEEPHWK